MKHKGTRRDGRRRRRRRRRGRRSIECFCMSINAEGDGWSLIKVSYKLLKAPPPPPSSSSRPLPSPSPARQPVRSRVSSSRRLHNLTKRRRPSFPMTHPPCVLRGSASQHQHKQHSQQ
eukprot:759029-Hanusia_phi.AAC.2